MNCSFGSEDAPFCSVGLSSEIVPLLSCKQDMMSHLLSLGISGKRGWGQDTAVTEIDLILNRSGFWGEMVQDIESKTICPKHRRDLTIDWASRKGKTCCYPTHQDQKKQIQQPRRVTATMAVEILMRHNFAVPIGAGKMCAMNFQVACEAFLFQ